MPRYVALLRGVSPMNAKMPELKRAFEQGGFTNVRTVLASGNAVFDARAGTDAAIARRAETAMDETLGRHFGTLVRSSAYLVKLLASDPFGGFGLDARARCVVTFLREPAGAQLALPIERDGARILATRGCEAYTAYLPTHKGPVFMALIEKAFGKDVTTRTLDTVRKCASA